MGTFSSPTCHCCSSSCATGNLQCKRRTLTFRLTHRYVLTTNQGYLLTTVSPDCSSFVVKVNFLKVVKGCKKNTSAAPLQLVNPRTLASKDPAPRLCPIYGSVTERSATPTAFLLSHPLLSIEGAVGQSFGLPWQIWGWPCWTSTTLKWSLVMVFSGQSHGQSIQAEPGGCLPFPYMCSHKHVSFENYSFPSYKLTQIHYVCVCVYEWVCVCV